MSDRKEHSRGAGFADPIELPTYGIIAGISALCVILLAIRMIRTEEEPFGFMLWNLFLAWLPLIVSLLGIRFARMRGGGAKIVLLTLSGIAWLLLYPNAPYLTTDFIHLIFRRYDPDGLILWYDLVVFFLFAWCGLLLGYASMRHYHEIVRRYAKAGAGWLFVATASFLGGFGVYLGRVVRLNSWDALFNPFRLIEGVLVGLNSSALIFTLLIGILILIVYVSLYTMQRGRA
ncbi:DUF1361 domain-containing protein [Cohnella candidum]|uniref:DUF1361 domain-containing protein n=1 Tax=Cohnella candidum TaxID=2674991 RepID=A0A3G3JXI9_9BACL|nr:DUF1361 domain-containing protein [Cohnella candidum]AYQ72872.1 DUF1361 domain-containing protein [Cohnella candidum]